MWDQDWSVKHIPAGSSVLQTLCGAPSTDPAEQQEHKAIIDKLNNRKVPPFMLGKPKWYTDLCAKPKDIEKDKLLPGPSKGTFFIFYVSQNVFSGLKNPQNVYIKCQNLM